MTQKVETSLSKQALPVGVPQDYLELSDCYAELLQEASSRLGQIPTTLLENLRTSRTIEEFDIARSTPRAFSRDDVLAYLGFTSAQWAYLFSSTLMGSGLPAWRVRPRLASGEFAQADLPTNTYLAQGILQLRASLVSNRVPLPRPVCAHLSEAFRQHLITKLAQVSVPQEVWPSDLPRNANEMMSLYGDFLVSQVRRVSKIRTDDELNEVVQHTWEALLSAKVLDKFLSSARTKLPRTLTQEEAQAYLGLSPEVWVKAMATQRQQKRWVPEPLRGPVGEVVYITTDIQTWDESGCLEGLSDQARKRPEASARGFKAYLGTAIYNHFKNLLRTRSRRHKERCLDANTLLTPNSSGDYRRSFCEEAGSWEDSLTSESCEMESLLDLVAELRRKKVQPNTAMGRQVIDHMQRRGMTLHMAIRSASLG